MKHFNRSTGFSLLEVMIALFVMSVGMLGSTAMMLRGQQQAVVTNNDGIAVELARSMAERMRANIQGVEDGHYDALVSGGTNPGCISGRCSSMDLALYNAWLWQWEMDNLLPNRNASGRVTRDGVVSQDSVYTITVSWTETQKTGTDTGAEVVKNYVMKVQP